MPRRGRFHGAHCREFECLSWQARVPRLTHAMFHLVRTLYKYRRTNNSYEYTSMDGSVPQRVLCALPMPMPKDLMRLKHFKILLRGRLFVQGNIRSKTGLSGCFGDKPKPTFFYDVKSGCGERVQHVRTTLENIHRVNNALVMS